MRLLLICGCWLWTHLLAAQSSLHPLHIHKNRFYISMGIGYEDGLRLLWKQPVPVLGLGYERLLHKRLSLVTHVLAYYRSMPDSYPLGVNGQPVLDKFRGTNDPFLTPAEKDALARTGFQPLDPNLTVDFLSVPLDIGLAFYPFSLPRHRLGIRLGYALTYESGNWPKDYLSGVLTLPDGTKQGITLSVPTEFHNISAGLCGGVSYDYSFDKYIIGVRAMSYNVLMIDWFSLNQSVYDTSFSFGIKF